MNEWSRRRKRIIMLIVFTFLILVIGLPAYLIFYKAPTCFDNKLNGDETGIDCGGSCSLLCRAESLPLLSQGDPRVLTVAPNVYEIVALVKNPNTTGEVYRAKYVLNLYDAKGGVPLKTIEGEAYIPRGASFTVFEGPFTLDEGFIPTKATLEWLDDSLVWKVNKNISPEIVVTSKTLSKEDSRPRIDAMIKNNSLETVSNIDLTTLVYDENGNVFAASKTFVDSLAPGASAPIVFTWPRPFGSKALNTEIQIRLFPDKSFIR